MWQLHVQHGMCKFRSFSLNETVFCKLNRQRNISPIIGLIYQVRLYSVSLENHIVFYNLYHCALNLEYYLTSPDMFPINCLHKLSRFVGQYYGHPFMSGKITPWPVPPESLYPSFGPDDTRKVSFNR